MPPASLGRQRPPQTKASRLGMNLMGQCLFSRDLVIGLGAKTVRSIALCTQDDFTLRPLLEQHQGCEVVVFDGDLDTLAPYTPQGIS